MKIYTRMQMRLREAEWLTSQTLSLYLSYLVLTGIPLLFALPTPSRIDELMEPKLNFLGLFSTVTILLFIAYGLNMGIAYAKSSPSASWFSLPARIALLWLLALPYWTIYQGLTALAPDRLLWALLYLLGQGFCWAYGGWLIAMRWPSEITQFNIKYALAALILIATFFVLQALNPFLMLSLWLSESPLHNQGLFLATGYGGLLLALLTLAHWVSRMTRKTGMRQDEPV